MTSTLAERSGRLSLVADRFALYVSCVPEEGPVTRFGTRTIIGGERGRNEVTFRPDEVVAITTSEFARYRREYTRALSNGSLRSRTAAEWKAQNESDQRGGTPAAPETAPAQPAAPPSAGVSHAHDRGRPKR